MRTITIGTTFSLDVGASTVGFLRLRPSDHLPSYDRLDARQGDGIVETVVLDDVGVYDVGAHAAGAHALSSMGLGQRMDRLVVPPGRTTIEYAATVEVDDEPDVMPEFASAPDPATLTPSQWWWVQPSRYCRPDELGAEAWATFGSEIQPGRPATGGTVRRICAHVNEQMQFAYGSTSAETGAGEAWRQRTGVCRDFNHIAVSFCRALNIPARYVFGYMPDVDVIPNGALMDFCAWFEVLLDGRWWTFDARVNERRVGRIPVARGRDAADVPLISTLGHVDLSDFAVHAEELVAPSLVGAAC